MQHSILYLHVYIHTHTRENPDDCIHTFYRPQERLLVPAVKCISMMMLLLNKHTHLQTRTLAIQVSFPFNDTIIVTWYPILLFLLVLLVLLLRFG